MPQLTSDEYAEKYQGCVCPVCMSYDIEAEPLETDGAYGHSFVVCHQCHSCWQDSWECVGYYDLEVGSE